MKCVALVDWNWSGHHPTYYKLYVSALVELGIRVLPFCPAPVDLPALLASTPAGQSPEKLALVDPAQPISFPPHRLFRPSRFRPMEHAIRHFGGLGKRLREWERTHGQKVDLVFFACIYDTEFESFRYAKSFFRFPWSGLYLHARSFRMPGSPHPGSGRMPCPEKIFTLPSVHSAAVLDEGAVEPMQKLARGRRVVAFPDLTDERLPVTGDAENGLAEKILGFARGRPVVSLLGHLQKTKGIEEFTRAAQAESLRGLFFFLGGEAHLGDFPPKTREELLRTWARLPNLGTHLCRIEDGPTLNAVMASSNIIYAAYSNFPHSSNIMTKAARFERPLIVSDGYLMAERTRAYALGEVVPEGDLGAIIASLRRLGGIDQPAPKIPAGRWRDYLAMHSYQRLLAAFAELLGKN
jgi:hypothetical protein